VPQGYPDKEEEEFTFVMKQNIKKTSGVLKGYTAWKTKQPTVGSSSRSPLNPGNKLTPAIPTDHTLTKRSLRVCWWRW